METMVERKLSVSPKMFARMRAAALEAEAKGEDGAVAALATASLTLGDDYSPFEKIEVVVDQHEAEAFPDGVAVLRDAESMKGK